MLELILLSLEDLKEVNGHEPSGAGPKYCLEFGKDNIWKHKGPLSLYIFAH